MDLVVIYTVLVALYATDIIVGECVIRTDIPEVKCIVLGKPAVGDIGRRGTIWVTDIDGEMFALTPKGDK